GAGVGDLQTEDPAPADQVAVAQPEQPQPGLARPGDDAAGVGVLGDGDRGAHRASPSAPPSASSAAPLSQAASAGTPSVDHRLGRLTTMPSWVLRPMTTTASSSGEGFSSRCGT